MKGFMSKALAGACLTGGLMSAGCTSTGEHASKVSDPCWPDRYSNESRKLVVESFEPQVQNGHVLDQTVWNKHFETGKPVLNLAGMDKLDQLARRRPAPDGRVYLQTARDIGYNPEKAGDYSAERNKLDADRIAAVQKYLAATLTGRAVTIDVLVHDPSYPGIEGAAARVTLPRPRAAVVAPGAPGQTPPAGSGTTPSGSSGTGTGM